MSTAHFTAKEKLAINLAGIALRAAMAEDWPRVNKIMEDLSDRTGGDGVGLALQGWADTLLRQANLDTSKPIGLAFQEVGTGRIGTADDVPATTRWAGQMLTARANDDQDTWIALLAAIPEDEQFGAYVGALLHMVATNLKRLG